jgi:hypothetical protein
MKKLLVAATTACLCVLAGCGDSAPPAAAVKKEVAPPEPVTGRSALYQMYGAARSWAADAQVLELHSIHLPEVKSERGKAAAWQATFVSQQAGRSRTYTYSVIEAEGNLHKGVFAGQDEGWSGPRGTQKPFLIAAVKTDSNEVFETALKKAGDYEKKSPNKGISFVLEQTSRYPDAVWRVIWGESVGTSDFSIVVDASTGVYQQTLR